MSKLVLLALLVLPSLAAAQAPADSVEYVYRWPVAAGTAGPADAYEVRFTQGADIRVRSVAGTADSFNIVKPAFGPTVYGFTITVTALRAGVRVDSLSVSHTYTRPAPVALFPAGAVIEVDSSKVVRP